MQDMPPALDAHQGAATIQNTRNQCESCISMMQLQARILLKQLMCLAYTIPKNSTMDQGGSRRGKATGSIPKVFPSIELGPARVLQWPTVLSIITCAKLVI